MEANEILSRKSRLKPSNTTSYKRHSLEFKKKAVQFCIQEGRSAYGACQELGVTRQTLNKWIRAYKKSGDTGLERPPRGKHVGRNTPEPVKKEIIRMKEANRMYGVQRISDVLRRMLFIKVSPTTVSKTLIDEGLATQVKRPRHRNPSKPRFFERSTPNQMWQSDIMVIRLGGENAYIIAYVDDYSRFITALGLYRSQTSEHVLEVYRQGKGEFGVPREMLTDNGRQYTSWRGMTKFEQELKKDHVKHIKSRPHHPMTLGKVERFWKTLFEEFLSKAQFEDFENARHRLNLWVKYYNYRRPHQGIEGICPADRFFEIAHELRKAIEGGIAENVLELALRGEVTPPFYMVGRLGTQEVALRAEKGKLHLVLDDEKKEEKVKEVIYDIMKGAGHGDDQEARAEAKDVQLQRDGTVRSGVGGVGGATQAEPGMQINGDPVGDVEPLAGPGVGGYVAGAGADASKRDGGPEVKQPAAEVIGTASVVRAAGDSAAAGSPAGGRCGESEGAAGVVTEGGIDEHKRTGAGTGECDHGGAQREDDGGRRCAETEGLTKDVLRDREPGADGDDGRGAEPSCGPAEKGVGAGEKTVEGPGTGAGEGTGAVSDEAKDPVFGRRVAE